MRLFKEPGLISLVLLVALILVAEVAAPVPPPAVRDRYNHFLTQHRDNSNTNTGGRYCKTTMFNRDLARTDCKPVNSFIHASNKQINAVCGNQGEPYGRGTLRISCKPFRVTTCNLRGGSTRPPCDYRHDNRPRYIVIDCDQGFPVHYDEGNVIVNRERPCKRR